MARRFEGFYKTKRLDNLGDVDWHDRRWDDIDRRMHAREIDATKIDDAVDRMEAVALSRLNDTFSPIIAQAQAQLADVGVSFSGRSLSTHEISLGVKIFIITEAYRVGLVVVDYVSIRPTGVTDAAMICSVTSYDRTTGTLVVEPQDGYITGTGTYSDWTIRVSVTPNLDTYSREEVNAEIEDAINAIVGTAPEGMNTFEDIAGILGGTAAQSAVLMRSNNLSDIVSAAQARANIGLGNINNTSDATKPVSALQRQAIDAVIATVFPTGTTMIFHQAVVPVGWIRSVTHNDKTIRVVNSIGGGAGGVQPWSTVFGRVNVDNTTLTANTIPSHAHSVYDPTHAHSIADPWHIHGLGDPTHNHGHYSYVTPDYANWQYIYGGPGGNMGMGVSAATSHAGTGQYVGSYPTGIGIYGAYASIQIYAAGGSQPHTHGLDLRCQYVDVLIGTKS